MPPAEPSHARYGGDPGGADPTGSGPRAGPRQAERSRAEEAAASARYRSERRASGVEHLQAAALEMIAAARAMLDVIEDFVEDPERVRDAVDVAGSTLGDVITLAKRPQRANNPWFDEAWVPEPGPGSGREPRRTGMRTATDASSAGADATTPSHTSGEAGGRRPASERAPRRSSAARPSSGSREGGAGFERIDLA